MNFYSNVIALQDISGIVTNEKRRLDDKQKNIDAAFSNQERIILLNKSYGERMQQYTFISIVLAITFILVAVLLYLQNNFDIVPSSVYDLVMALLIGGSLLYSYNLYNNILLRDKLDFSKVSPDSPVLITAAQLEKDKAAAIASGNISGALVSATTGFGTCVGASCCPEKYDISNNVCAFTTLEQAHSEYKNAYTNNFIIAR